MRRKFGKKLMALTMAGVMMCTPMTVFAATGTTEETTSPAEGDATGAGELEGYLDESDEIFKVVLPTDDSSAPTFGFVMDPQNLLKATDSSNYTTNDTVLFSTKNGTSNELSITNKSQFDVDLSLTATMSGLTGDGYEIKMAADDTFQDAEGNDLTDTSLYLGLVYETATANGVDAVPSTTEALTDTGITATATLGGMPGNYEIQKDGSGYKYAEKASAATATGVAKFKMTGACNPNADWSAIDDATTPAAPTVKVVWSVKKHVDTPSVASTSLTISKSTGATLNVDLGSNATAATTVTSIGYGTSLSGSFSTFKGVTYSDGVITIPASAVSAVTSGTNAYMRVIFDDTNTTTQYVAITIQ